MTIREIRKLTGLSAQKFGDKYHIPLRTIQSWEAPEGQDSARSCPVYVRELLERAVKEDFKDKL